MVSRVVSLILGLSLAAFFGVSEARAGGFYVPEIGPRATGMAGAMVAQSSDTTALFHNPAGLAGQAGTQVQVAGSLFFGNVEHWRRPVQDPTGSEVLRFAPVRNTNPVGGAPYVAAVSDVNVPGLALGIGVYAPFGAHLEYPRSGAQRYVVSKVNFRTIYVTPTVAYRFLERFSIGVGFSYIYSDIAIDQVNSAFFVTGDPELFPDNPAQDGLTQLRGQDPASFGANLGLLYTDPEGRFGLGASLMVPTKLKFGGRVRVINEQITALQDEDGNELQPAGVRDDDFTMGYPLPLVLRLGTMVRPHERVMIEADVNWSRWKTFDTLVVDFENNYELLPTPGAFMSDIVLEQRWSNTLTARLGTDVTPLDPERIPLHVRAGVLYDQSPISDRYFDVLAPDSDKFGLSAGLGYTFDIRDRVELTADVGYMHLFFRERAVDPQSVGAPLRGNDEDERATNDSMDNPFETQVPGSNKTILNKPAPSHYHGVTRVFFDILSIGVTLRI